MSRNYPRVVDGKVLCCICDRPHHAKGYCGRHYRNYWLYGDPLFNKINIHNGKKCKIPECDRPHFAKGYCKAHYLRLLKTGIVVDIDGYRDIKRKSWTRRIAATGS